MIASERATFGSGSDVDGPAVAPAGTRGPYSHLETDGPREAWLTLVDEFVAERRRDRLAAQGLLPGNGR